jgi:hypothetical protein
MSDARRRRSSERRQLAVPAASGACAWQDADLNAGATPVLPFAHPEFAERRSRKKAQTNCLPSLPAWFYSKNSLPFSPTPTTELFLMGIEPTVSSEQKQNLPPSAIVARGGRLNWCV